MHSTVKAFPLASSVLAPLTFTSLVTSPLVLNSLVSVVAPPTTADGLIYDRITGNTLYDAATGAALTI